MASRLMAQERRKTPRITERLSLAITDASTRLDTETKNLSASGAYCTLDRFVAPMTKLQLEFELPGRARPTKIRCCGVVVRVEPLVANAEQGRFDTAIFFTELAERDRSAIARFVRQRLSSHPASG